MPHRLPRTVIPQRYRIEMHPDLSSHSFTGSVRVAAEVVEATDRLVCNCADLTIASVTVDGSAAAFVLDAAMQQLVVDFGEQRAPGPVELEVAFAGELNDELRGFYRSTFDDDGQTRTIATTQFQSTDARRAFPCWDEPDLKAEFDITLVVEPNLLAISNGAEVERVTLDDGKVAVRFATTMIMSTYLVAFVVGPLEATEPAFANEVPVRIIHRPGQGHLTGFALEVAVAALGYFEDYYGIAYPADKLDMVALPDFAMGAMENLGCVTYREILLLVDPDAATQPELSNVADVINHELAHMWFGDLVTMAWWNGIWLNEAFATFMEMKATDKFRPEWQRWTSFGMSRSVALDVDALDSTRPIEFPVISPDDAEGMFDVLTYEKGAAVVRMLEQWLGEDVFRDGIRHYLSTHRFGNTETHDLWDALEAVSGRPVTKPMESWIFQGGYPIVEPVGSSLAQKRFRLSPEPIEAGDGPMWSIPVGIRTSDGAAHIVELDGPAADLGFAVDEIESFNRAGNGFYRVKLPPDRLAALGRSGPVDLNAVERFGLIDDTWALTLAGEVELADFLALAEGFRGEDDVSVWQRIIGALSFIGHVAPEEMVGPFGKRVAHLIGDARERLGDTPADSDSARTRQLRGSLFRVAGRLVGDPSVIETAHRIHDEADTDAELVAASVTVIAASGGEADFENFRNRYLSADNPQEERRYLDSLPEFRAPEHIELLTDMALDGTIRSQNAPFVLAQALTNRDNGPAVWRRIMTAWSTIEEQFPTSTIVRMLDGVRWLTRPDDAAEVRAFFAERALTRNQKQLDQHLERMSINSAFRQRAHAQLPEILAG